MSPRRSSRARTTQPPPGPPAHTNSSTSITSLSRAERNTRSGIRPPSPKRSSTQRSESVEAQDATRPESQAPRRSRRGNDLDKDEPAAQVEEDQEMDDLEEEITRCICGQAEYPGPPAVIRESRGAQDPATDDLGNFFVQCDQCHVWQHGGCMGFTDEDQLPDEYYCETCKPQLHRTIRGPNGTKSSRYLPLDQEPESRSSSLSSATVQNTKRDGKTRLSQDINTKRRATMNSRVAYDEDEMLRRAIEESKETGSLGKRPREDSEDTRQNIKRRRTSSTTGSGSQRGRSMSPGTGGRTARSNGSNSKLERRRGAAARTYKEKEYRDQLKEEAAAQRAEAANKRNARSERRRAEDSPAPTPSLSPSKAAPHNAKTDPSPSHKAAAAPTSNPTRKVGVAARTNTRRGRVGRNQHTRDNAHLNGDANETTPRRGSPQDGTNDSPPSGSGSHGHGHSNNHKTGAGNHLSSNGINGEISGRSSKAKTHPARTSMNEMKRRVAAILEFVSRMQIEQPAKTTTTSSSEAGGGGAETGSGSAGAASKGSSTPNGVHVHDADGSTSTSSNGISTSTDLAKASASSVVLPGAALVNAVEAGLKAAATNNDAGPNGHASTGSGSGAGDPITMAKVFAHMGSGEMMESLTGELLRWQSVYGRYGEK